MSVWSFLDSLFVSRNVLNSRYFYHRSKNTNQKGRDTYHTRNTKLKSKKLLALDSKIEENSTIVDASASTSIASYLSKTDR